MKQENDAYIVEGSEETGCLLSLKILVKPAQAQKIFKKATKKINKEISIPGFRKGKAPDDTVISRYSSYVDQEWKELLVNEAYRAALDMTKVYPLRRESIQKPKIESCSQEEGAIVLLSYEHYPHLPTIDFSTLHIPQITKEPIDEKRIDEILEEIQRSHADWEEVTDRAVRMGDFVNLSIDAIDQDPPKSIVKDRRFEVEEARMAPWLTKLLIGLKVGETAEGTTEVDQKADESAKATFKPTEVKIELSAIKKILLPPVDDELAKKVGADSKEDLLAKIRTNLEHEAEANLREKQFLEVQEALLKKYPFDLPTSLKEAEHRERLKSRLEELKRRKLSDEEIQKAQKEIEEQVALEVDRFLQLHFLEQQIAKQGHLTVTHHDLSAEIEGNPLLQRHLLNKETSDRLISRLSADIMSRKIKEFALSEVGKQTKT